ncbi:hypothetical protein [Sphingomonas sp.]|uniref:hypothetical protein n=1 Tax=Sphingomonas sp. TaxID=28214 RepID=UPI002ED8E8CF
MSMHLTRFALGSFAVAAAFYSTPATAGTGCNGVVNVFVWGCAPWDNNNGPQYPYYRKKAVVLPAKGTQIVTKDGIRMALRNGTYYPLIGQDGAGIISRDGAGVIGQDGAGFRVWSQ